MHEPRSTNSTALRYRPDIDGLRTIAVVPVVLFHAGFSIFSGGFVGVDVFFVISGYLITGLLLKDIALSRFSIFEFYRRRIQRILPALLVVLAASTIAALAILPPRELERYGSSLGFVSTFASNFWFRKAVDYFAANAHFHPLLHTWSLAVEEQFYIFYPLLLYLVSRTRVNLSHVLLATGVASLLLAVTFLPIAPSSVFYLLPTRAWELVIGGLLASQPVPQFRNMMWMKASGFAGLFLILVPVATYTTLTPFPGIAAVPPCVGAALLIWSGQSEGPVSGLLSSRPFVLVGQASYSFYLWHFPIFAYATYLIAGPLSVGEGLLLSAVSLSLAFASLYLFENPVRHARTKIAWVTPLALIAVMGAVGFSLASSNGLPRRLGDRSASFVATSHDETRHHSDCMTNTTIVPPDRACVLGDSASVPHTLLWGDSHAMIVATAMEAAAKKEGKSFKFAASADCPQGLGLAISDQTQPSLTRLISYRYCGKYNRKMFDLAVSDPNIRNIVFAARWTNWRIGEPGNKDETPVDIRLEWNGVVARSEFENRRIWESSFLDLVRALRAKGKQIYIVGPVPEPPFNVPQRFYVAQFGLVSQPEPLPIEDFYSRHRVILDFFSRLEKAKDIHFIWPHKKLCHDNLCDLEEGGHLLYFDDNHLSVYGALQTAPLYDKLFMSTGS